MAEPTLLDRIHSAYIDSTKCQRTWVMDLDWYKQIRRYQAATMRDSEQDEEKWIPSTDDHLFGLRVLVRGDGGEPHIEWLTDDEIKTAPKMISGADDIVAKLKNAVSSYEPDGGSQWYVSDHCIDCDADEFWTVIDKALRGTT